MKHGATDNYNQRKVKNAFLKEASQCFTPAIWSTLTVPMPHRSSGSGKSPTLTRSPKMPGHSTDRHCCGYSAWATHALGLSTPREDDLMPDAPVLALVTMLEHEQPPEEANGEPV